VANVNASYDTCHETLCRPVLSPCDEDDDYSMPDFDQKRQSGLSCLCRANSQFIVTTGGAQ